MPWPHFDQLRCIWCGQFIGESSDARHYTPFGRTTDLEPPDPEFICGKCWGKLDADWRDYYTNPKRVWIPAQRYEMPDPEVYPPDIMLDGPFAAPQSADRKE